MRTRSILVLLAAIAAAGVAVACDKAPTAPRLARPSPPSPTVAVRIDVEGPRSVPPGQNAQFTATARFSDGTSREVTGEAAWQSTNPAVLSISEAGLATGHQPGETTLRVSVPYVSTTREVIVVPPGTYRLSGLVSDAESASVSVPVAEARLEILGGPAAGLVTTTGDDGRYRLFGVSGDATVRVSKTGYQDQVESVHVEDHQARNFLLTPAPGRRNVSGTYTLTIAAADECSAALPEQARVRTYRATLVQAAWQVVARLSGATFVRSRTGSGDSFRGSVNPDGLTFVLNRYHDEYYYWYGPQYADIAEQLSPSLYLVVEGSVSIAGWEQPFSGALDGAFRAFASDLRWATPSIAECRSAAHRFVLSPSE